MKYLIIYFFLHVFFGVFTGYMGVYINFSSHKKKYTNYHLFIALMYFMYMILVAGLVQGIWWITNNTSSISELYKGVSTIIMLLSVYPGAMLAKRYKG
ncbi:hypothetical protein Metme_1434 [Methylomonas methanica MC09]|uniref:Uncharacterized protein n=1 Tax=Methylomonas methanica (strain DSM 25384 / MC09) TaxID=857087 RepID=F9ZZ02_METMM|nr:hypothetical protein Metme_1434 [Methylomonas methanica MC09]